MLGKIRKEMINLVLNFEILRSLWGILKDMSSKFLPILFYAQDKDWTTDQDVDGRAIAMTSEAIGIFKNKEYVLLEGKS